MCVEDFQTRFEGHKGFGSLELDLGIVNEVDECLDNSKCSLVHCPSHYTNEHLFHFFMFGSSPLRHIRNPIFEVPQTWEIRHRLETRIKLRFANQGCAPRYKVIFEDALMKLVEKIRGETGKDVAMRQIVPERLVYWP